MSPITHFLIGWTVASAAPTLSKKERAFVTLASVVPFPTRWQLAWSGQWPLSAWQYMVITAVLLLLAMVLARRRGYSPLEMFSKSADGAFVRALRERFPRKGMLELGI